MSLKSALETAKEILEASHKEEESSIEELDEGMSANK